MNTIEKLKAERQLLAERLEEIDKILSQFDELQRVAEKYFSTGTPHTEGREMHSDSASGAPSDLRHAPSMTESTRLPSAKQKTPMSVFMDTVLQVLADADEPLDRSALYAALSDRGVVIGSPDEKSDLNTLSARMSRMSERVTNVKGHGYWLKERDFPQGSYTRRVDVDITPTPSMGEEI